jgi:hypothetical protein
LREREDERRRTREIIADDHLDVRSEKLVHLAEPGVGLVMVRAGDD